MQKIKGKNIWITGASSGIGESMAYVFAKQGAKLILSGRNEERLIEVANQCKGTQKPIVVPFDLADESSIKKAAEFVIKNQTVDILVHNGGISQRSLAMETAFEVDKKIMQINFFGSVVLTKKILPEMIKAKSGHIVVISSIVGKFGYPKRTAYSASKHALHGFYESLRCEHLNDNIYVSIICPGSINTNIAQNALDKDGKPFGKIDKRLKDGMPADICARKIVAAVKKQKKEVYIGGKEILMVYFKKYLSFLFYKIVKNKQNE